MNKTITKLFSSVMVLILLLGAFSMVASADSDKAVITITEVDTGAVTADDAKLPIKKLVFNVKTPTGASKSMANSVILSWDSSVVALVHTEFNQPLTTDMYADYLTAEAVAKPLSYEAAGAFGSVKIESWNWAPGGTIANVGTRYAMCFEQVAPDPAKNAVDLTAGNDFLEIYFVVKKDAVPVADSFKLESNAAEGSLLRQIYPNEASKDLAAVQIKTPEIVYMYGNASSTVSDTATLAEFSWEGSIPTETEADISTITIEGATEVKLPAALSLTLGGTTPVGVTAKLMYKLSTAEDIEANWSDVAPTAADTYNVKVVATAAEGYVVTGTAATTTATILAADPVEETNDLEITAENGTTATTLEDAVAKKKYKDLFVVDASIKHGLEAGKTIVKWGVRFHDAANLNVGGGIVEFTPDEDTKIAIEGGELKFKAAIIGVPAGVEVKAVPFVVSK